MATSCLSDCTWMSQHIGRTNQWKTSKGGEIISILGEVCCKVQINFKILAFFFNNFVSWIVVVRIEYLSVLSQIISIEMHTFDESVCMKFLRKFFFFHSFVDLCFGFVFPGELADGLLDAHFFLRTLPSKPTKYSDIAISVVNMLPDNDHSLLMKMNVKNQVYT